MGVGGLSWAFTTQDFNRWEDPDGRNGTIRPLVADVTTNLLGRDFLEYLNALATGKWECLQIEYYQNYQDQKNSKS